MALIDPQLRPEPIQERESLNERFRFDLREHQLQDPESSHGYVSSIVEMGAVQAFGHVVPVSEIRVVDPFVKADPDTYDLVKRHIEEMEKAIIEDGFNPLIERRQKYPYSKDDDSDEVKEARKRRNQYTDAWLHDENVQPLNEWHKLIPSAVALGHLTEPWLDRTFTLKDGSVIPTTPETTAHLRFVDDAVAIRDRAVAMQEIAVRHLSSLEVDRPVQWLDLASGTAEPSIKAATQASKEKGMDVNLTVVDYDTNALSFVEGIAQREGFKGYLKIKEGYIMDPSFADDLEHKQDGYDVVENLGFEEYMPERDAGDGLGSDEMGAFREMDGLPNASDFTRWAYDLVKPGGVLISGNMALPRPQVNFVFGIVNWPIINARSPESILRIYKRAGILDDPNARVEIFRVTDDITGSHVYDIVKVTKVDSQQNS